MSRQLPLRRLPSRRLPSRHLPLRHLPLRHLTLQIKVTVITQMFIIFPKQHQSVLFLISGTFYPFRVKQSL